ncbi:class E sortase [Cellulomonas sp. zg-ZUI222]|uniref:Class E sortase n=1 Tax=Cellulomonas wangleii TaxID=2816956 RepID=A0ABX8D4L8_9CELL|nr:MULTISPECIES: class E sortase [Cellulomonas]MBO0898585.1 class E sortase [Cellulomonas sp. zg-ZUI22]MBO0919447.1 class E sortase [Cellulomonas wangleii]MBO0924413.1 class E sortase [Cellulomonas wangleii]QVI62409.1 class E sortase [Cellulomonas wangleii]
MTRSATTERAPAHVRATRPRTAAGFFYGAVGVLGELLITLGVLLLGFLVWQLWWTDVEGDAVQAEIVRDLDFAPPAAAVDDDSGIAEPRRDEPPVIEEPAHAVSFATLQVPRWAGEPERPISQGTDRPTVLDVLGIGHYPGTAMPGGVGNFALAGHRVTYGKPFNRIEELQLGDPLVVRTADTWYVYRVTGTEVVLPPDVRVIAPVPNEPGVEPTERYITLTTCHPMFSARERFIVHGVLDYWAPVSSGTPAELLGTP